MGTYPVRVSARPDSPGRWLWLVKWLLLIPHYIVLAVLWLAFVALTLIAYVAVLFTGRYPAGIFDFNVGVLRWSWRVGYYGYSALGTDRYPPFTLADVPDYPARLRIEGPPRPPRWLPLVAWLLALPHLVLVGLLTGSGWTFEVGDARVQYTSGVLGVLVLIAGLAVLFTGRYPKGLYDVVVGLDRWVLRTVAYVALLTDRYPPLRLDLGGDDPGSDPTGPAPDALPAPDRAAPRNGTFRSDEAPPAARSGGPAGRIVSIVAGVLLLLVGGGAMLTGVAALGLNASRDRGGYFATEPIAVSTSTAALTAEGIEIHPADRVGRDITGLDAIRITVLNPGRTPLFLGVGPESDVDGWLGGTAHDELTDVYASAPGARVLRSVGSLQPVTPPAGQSFWSASTVGNDTLVLEWKPVDGRFAIVLANTDGALDVAAQVTVAVRLTALGPLGTALVTGGIVALLAAFALIIFGATGLARGGRRRTPPPVVNPPRSPAEGPMPVWPGPSTLLRGGRDIEPGKRRR